jgi:hypothetical protein
MLHRVPGLGRRRGYGNRFGSQTRDLNLYLNTRTGYPMAEN